MKNYVIAGHNETSFVGRTRSVLLDFLRNGRTLIITGSADTKAIWVTEAMKMLNMNPLNPTIEDSKKLEDYLSNHLDFLCFRQYNAENPDLVLTKKFDVVIVEEAYSFQSFVSVPRWVTLAKNVNADCALVVLAYSEYLFFQDKIDMRYRPLTTVKKEHIEAALFEDDAPQEDLPPVINIHVCKKDVDKVSEVYPATLVPFKSTNKKICRSVEEDEFAQAAVSLSVEEIKLDSIRCFTKIPKTIDLLSKSIELVSTAMACNPIPTYGRRMSDLIIQINRLYDKMSISTFDETYISLHGRERSNLIFCNKGKADLVDFRRGSASYVKEGFNESTIGYAENSFCKDRPATLIISNEDYMPTPRIMTKCNNIFLFGDWRTDVPFLKRLLKRVVNDVDIVIPCSARTTDESNVAHALSMLDNSMFNVIKHDLSS